MTPTDLAAAILRDVRRYTKHEGWQHSVDPDGEWLSRDEVLAALSAAMDPALSERAGEVLERLQKADEYEPLGHDGWEAADLITDLLAQNAALRAERDTSNEIGRAFEEDAGQQRARAEAAEAKVKRLRAERDDALTFLDNAVSKAPEPLKDLGKYLAGRLDEDEWPTAEQYLNAAAKACADRAALSAATEQGHDPQA